MVAAPSNPMSTARLLIELLRPPESRSLPWSRLVEMKVSVRVAADGKPKQPIATQKATLDRSSTRAARGKQMPERA